MKIEYPENHIEGITYIGLFQSLIPNHKPIIGKAIINKRYCSLDNIPSGTFYLLVCSVKKSKNIINYFILESALRGKVDQALIFPRDNNVSFNVVLREAIDTDLPITISLATLLQKNIGAKVDTLE